MIKINLSQKKIIIVAVGVMFAFLAAWFLAYLPSQTKIKQLKALLANTDGQIHQIEAMVENGKTIEEGMRLLAERYGQLSSKFSPKEEESIKLLSDFARQLHIEITSTRYQPKTEFLNANQQVDVDGKKCQVVRVSIEMKCHYKDLVKYLETLSARLPVYITVEQMRIGTANAQNLELNVSFDVNLYLLV